MNTLEKLFIKAEKSGHANINGRIIEFSSPFIEERLYFKRNGK